LNEHPPKDALIPKMVPGFGDRNNPAKKVEAGPACGMVIDSRDALYLWVKFY
jgi:hypothetical protein